MQLNTIITFLIPVAVATHHYKTLLKTILESKGNLFTNVNKDFQNIMNNLFASLDLSETFIGKPRVQLLLTMHYDLKSIAERNYDAYEKMKNITIIDRNQTTNKIELFDLIEEILNDKHLNLSVGIKEKPDLMHKHAKLKTKTNVIDSEFGDSKEFTKFIYAFIKKIDNLSVKDFTEKSPIIPRDEKEKNSTVYNLKVWKPPPIISIDSVNDTGARRLYLGKKANIVHYPFVVSIHLLGVFACAGSIISADLILTAASCLQLLHNNRFFRENPRDLYVRIGSESVVLGGEIIDILEIFFHPTYDPKSLRNNLALLRLQKWINFMEKKVKVRRIRYDKRTSHLPVNTEGILTLGWGARKPNQLMQTFQNLRVTKLDLYQFNECQEIYSKHYLTDKHFCAGFISKGGGACNKDVGGPGIIGGRLLGVISFGPPTCGSVDSPTVFTKIGHYAEWIDTIVHKPRLTGGKRTTLLVRKKPRHPLGSFTTPRNPIAPIMTEAPRRPYQTDDI